MRARYFMQRKFAFMLFLALGLNACSTSRIRPINELNGLFALSANSYREPSLGRNWLVTLANKNGKEKIELIDLRNRRSVNLPGINRSDSQPISVSVSANGERLALIRQRADQTELLVYRRNLGTIQRLELSPKGIPRRVSIDGYGRLLAVQVSRDGRWFIDLIRLSDG